MDSVSDHLVYKDDQHRSREDKFRDYDKRKMAREEEEANKLPPINEVDPGSQDPNHEGLLEDFNDFLSKVKISTKGPDKPEILPEPDKKEEDIDFRDIEYDEMGQPVKTTVTSYKANFLSPKKLKPVTYETEKQSMEDLKEKAGLAKSEEVESTTKNVGNAKLDQRKLKGLLGWYKKKKLFISDDIMLKIREIFQDSTHYLVLVGDGMLKDPDINDIDSQMSFWDKYPEAKELLLTKSDVLTPEYLQ